MQPFDHTVRGALSPPHTSRALGSATQGHARDRDLRAALGCARQRSGQEAHSGRSTMVATRPESQAAPPHNSIFQDDCHLPAMVLLTGGYARQEARCYMQMHFRVRAAFRPHCSGCPFPSPHLKGGGIGTSGTSPRPRFEGCTRQPSGHEAHSANPFRNIC